MGESHRHFAPIKGRPTERADPIRVQLLGKIGHKTGFYLPKEEDIPLKKCLEARKARQDGPSDPLLKIDPPMM